MLILFDKKCLALRKSRTGNPFCVELFGQIVSFLQCLNVLWRIVLNSIPVVCIQESKRVFTNKERNKIAKALVHPSEPVQPPSLCKRLFCLQWSHFYKMTPMHFLFEVSLFICKKKTCSCFPIVLVTLTTCFWWSHLSVSYLGGSRLVARFFFFLSVMFKQLQNKGKWFDCLAASNDIVLIALYRV